jgi:D-3-phosphoglycerate dehydrogenase / 2-oxoglutarate reductase
MKVLIADKFEKSGIEGLKKAGCEVLFEPDLKDQSLADAVAASGADVLVVRSTKVKEPVIEAGRLSLIVRAGAGTDTIDVPAATRKGVLVANCPGKNSVAVAELAFGLILALDRRIPDNVAELRAGKWNKKEYAKAKGVYGRTLGVLGFGSIGQAVAARAQAFGMDLALWSELGIVMADDGLPVDLRRPSTTNVRVFQTAEEVAANCDILSVHVASNQLTRGLVTASVLEKMKSGACFVNTARGDVVDYAALEAAVKEKGLRVALDVFPGEPATPTGEFQSSLLQLPNVYGTHHIGASTDQAQEAIAAETVRIVSEYKLTGIAPNVINQKPTGV